MVHQFQYDVFSRGRPGAGVQTLVTVNPPLWFMEGMAEYLSLGPINPETAMWLRDAALEGHLPSIEEMTADPYIFPYRYGHALWAYIGEKWGDEVIGEILQSSATSGLEAAFKRATGGRSRTSPTTGATPSRRRSCPSWAITIAPVASRNRRSPSAARGAAFSSPQR